MPQVRSQQRFWKDPELQAQFRFVRALTKRYARSFYLATQFLPVRKRWATYAVYGFCRHADNIVDNPRQRSPEEVKAELRMLSNEISLAYRGGESEHPVVRPFIAVARIYGIPEHYAQELLLGVGMDLELHRYASFDDLYLFCYRVASVVGLMMMHILGFSNPGAGKYAEKLGVAMQLTNILRDIKEDKDNGHIYLPQDEMRRFAVDEEDILRETDSPALRELLRFQIERAEAYYREGEEGIALLDRDARFAICAASTMYRGILEKLAQRNYNPFQGRVYVPAKEKSKIIAREIVRAKLVSLQQLPFSNR